MIIYGIGNKLLKEAPVENMKCTNCNHESSVVHVYQRYFDLFWIPTFPVGKSIVLVCPSCQHVVKQKDFSEEFKSHGKTLKSSVSTPKYMFSGLVIILLIFSFFVYKGYSDGLMEEEYLSQPMKGDVYALYNKDEPGEYKYYYIKVIGLDDDSDSVLFAANNYNYDIITADLFPEDGFSNYGYLYHKNDLVEMFNVGEIVNIYRDYEEDHSFHQTFTDSLTIDSFFQATIDSLASIE